MARAPLWEELLEDKGADGRGSRLLNLPWIDPRYVYSSHRSFRIRWVGGTPLPTCPLSEEHWRTFRIKGRWAEPEGEASFDSSPEGLAGAERQVGYLAGDRLIEERVWRDRRPVQLISAEGLLGALLDESVRVHLVEVGLPRFARIEAARDFGGHWVYMQRAMPCGEEHLAQEAYEARQSDLSHMRNVAPSLDLAYRVAAMQRRMEEERQRQVAEELHREEEMRRMQERLGTAEGRRELAQTDFRAAATAALSLSGAALLDVSPGTRRGQSIVVFTYARRRFECLVRTDTLGIVNSGICLTDEETHERGDERLSLEVLPEVIQEAIDSDRLVVYGVR